MLMNLFGFICSAFMKDGCVGVIITPVLLILVSLFHLLCIFGFDAKRYRKIPMS